jgi:single-stranded-DNA-specific exonuclease
VLNILQGAQEYTLKMGGHARAAGFSVAQESLKAFEEALLSRAPAIETATHASFLADAVVDPLLLTWQTCQTLERFAPFGEGNKRPLFIVPQLHLGSWRPVGKKGDHAKYLFFVQDQPLDGIGFSLAGRTPTKPQPVDVAAQLDINEFRGYRRLQLRITDIAPAGTHIIKRHEG